MRVLDGANMISVSSIYFEPTPKNGILLDAGEGSYGQLYRRFGENLDEVFFVCLFSHHAFIN